MNDLAKCMGDDKFICGDSLTVADFVCGGFYVNLVLNEENRYKELWAEGFNSAAPDRLKQYIKDFKDEMADYLESRPKHSFDLYYIKIINSTENKEEE